MTADRPYRDAQGEDYAVSELKRLAGSHFDPELVKVTKELQEALARVKLLSGLLPICAYCKKIRDDKGCWKQLETYISEHSEAMFSHGICPACAKQAREELGGMIKPS